MRIQVPKVPDPCPASFLSSLPATGPVGLLEGERCYKFGEWGGLWLAGSAVTRSVSSTSSENQRSKDHFLLGPWPKQGRARESKNQGGSV